MRRPSASNDTRPLPREQGQVAALVTDVHLRSVLAGVRGLGRAGIPVVALARSRRAAGVLSRHVSAVAFGPDARTEPSSFAARVAELCAVHHPVVVYPGQEAAIDALVKVDESVCLAYGSRKGLDALRDKGRLPDLAAAADLRTPATLAIGTAGELRKAPPGTPCMVKPVRPGAKLASTTLLLSDGDAASLLAALPADELLLVQETMRGQLRALALVVDRDGRVAARFEQLASRIFPADVGISSEAVSVVPDEGLAARCADMLRTAGFSGLAQLQFIETPSGPNLIDVNPRFYGSLPLALAAGVNLPAVWHGVATGQVVAQSREYRIGVTYRWLEADMVAAGKGEVRLLVRRTPAPRVGAIWARDDPLPAILLGAQAATSRLGNLARRVLRQP